MGTPVLPESWAPPEPENLVPTGETPQPEPAVNLAAEVPAEVTEEVPAQPDVPAEPAAPEPVQEPVPAEEPAPAPEPEAAPAEPEPVDVPVAPEAPAEVPVADQLAAGVPSDSTVTLADQRAGVATAPVVVAEDGSLAPHPDVVPEAPTEEAGSADAPSEVPADAGSTPESADVPAPEMPASMASHEPAADGSSWVAPAAQPVAPPTADEQLAAAVVQHADLQQVAAKTHHALGSLIKIADKVRSDIEKYVPPELLKAVEDTALAELRSLI